MCSSALVLCWRRVLLFLEALALGREPPGFGIHLIASLADAAAKLGLRPLEVRWWNRYTGLPALMCVCVLGAVEDRCCSASGVGGCVGYAHASYDGTQFLGTPPSPLLTAPSPLPQEYCQQRLGAAESRLRYYRLDEIQQLNRSGGCWLMLDGMVLDIGR